MALPQRLILVRSEYSKKEWQALMAVVNDAGLICVPKVGFKALKVGMNPNDPLLGAGKVRAEPTYVKEIERPISILPHINEILGYTLHKALMRTARTGDSYSWQPSHETGDQNMGCVNQ